MDVTSVNDRRHQVMLLDVRERDEWAAGHIEGSVHIPMGELGAYQAALPADQTIVCVCRVGGRSAAVTTALVRAGYDAVNLEGGVAAWAAERLPLVTEAGEPGRVA